MRPCSGNCEAWRASCGKYKARIAIFWILAAVDRFSWISWKVESRWGKLESHWGKQKAVEKSRKPLTKAWKPLRKIRFRSRKIGFRVRKILIFPKRFSSFWRLWGLVLLQDLLPRVRTDLLCCAPPSSSKKRGDLKREERDFHHHHHHLPPSLCSVTARVVAIIAAATDQNHQQHVKSQVLPRQWRFKQEEEKQPTILFCW